MKNTTDTIAQLAAAADVLTRELIDLAHALATDPGTTPDPEHEAAIEAYNLARLKIAEVDKGLELATGQLYERCRRVRLAAREREMIAAAALLAQAGGEKLN
jgi:hypothetical protein